MMESGFTQVLSVLNSMARVIPRQSHVVVKHSSSSPAAIVMISTGILVLFLIETNSRFAHISQPTVERRVHVQPLCN